MADKLSEKLRTFVSIDTVAQQLLREAAAELDRRKARLTALEQALRAVPEWFSCRGTNRCLNCGGWQHHPAMDEDYYGKQGHNPDCLRVAALKG